MQTNFYATKEDKILILDFIFSETKYHIIDHYSEMGEELCQYKSTKEILEKFDLENGGQYSVCFSLWNPLDGTKDIIRKIDLNPQKCGGHTFRYSSDGWGTQKLYFGGIQNEILNISTFYGSNEKGAIERDLMNPESERIAHNLDWKLISSEQRKLKNFIEKKLSAEFKVKNYYILKNAYNSYQDKKFEID